MMSSTVTPFLLALAIGGLAIGCLINPDDARAAPPPNDDFANATLLTGDSGSVSVSILEATRETNEPTGDCPEEGTAWYKWVAQAPGELSVRTSFTGVIIARSCAEVYVGTSVDTLSTVDGRQVSFFGRAQTGGEIEETVEVQAGNTYYIQASSDSGTLDTPPPAEFSYTFTQPAVNLVAAVLPSARSVMVGTPATGYGALINTSSSELFPCLMAMPSDVPAAFEFRASDAENNFTAPLNEAVSVPAGAVQHFVFGITPSAPINSQDIRLIFDCRDTAPAASVSGLNTFLLSASDTPVADIVALAATQSGDGIVSLPGDTGANAFAVASVNVGSQDTITASADTGAATLPVALSICESIPATGACLAAPASSVTTPINAGATPTFSIFVTGTGTVPFDPAGNRIFVRFKDAGGVTRGSTSVAVRTQ